MLPVHIRLNIESYLEFSRCSYSDVVLFSIFTNVCVFLELCEKMRWLRLNYSKSLRIKKIFGFTQKIYSDSLAVYIGKRLWDSSLHARVKANSALISKSGRKSSQILLKVTPDNRKISFHSLFITASEKKPQIIPPHATSAIIHNGS